MKSRPFCLFIVSVLLMITFSVGNVNQAALDDLVDGATLTYHNTLTTFWEAACRDRGRYDNEGWFYHSHQRLFFEFDPWSFDSGLEWW